MSRVVNETELRRQNERWLPSHQPLSNITEVLGRIPDGKELYVIYKGALPEQYGHPGGEPLYVKGRVIDCRYYPRPRLYIKILLEVTNCTKIPDLNGVELDISSHRDQISLVPLSKFRELGIKSLQKYRQLEKDYLYLGLPIVDALPDENHLFLPPGIDYLRGLLESKRDSLARANARKRAKGALSSTATDETLSQQLGEIDDEIINIEKEIGEINDEIRKYDYTSEQLQEAIKLGKEQQMLIDIRSMDREQFLERYPVERYPGAIDIANDHYPTPHLKGGRHKRKQPKKRAKYTHRKKRTRCKSSRKKK